MFVKRVNNKNADIEVSNRITKCSCCGKPILGMPKYGARVPMNLCPACMHSRAEIEANELEENPANRLNKRSDDNTESR